MMKKYFRPDVFLNHERMLSAFQRNQLELLGVSEKILAPKSKQYPPPLSLRIKSPSSLFYQTGRPN